MKYNRLVERLKKDEGSVLIGDRHIMYKDKYGYPTIGYGRNLKKGISEVEAMILLNSDINEAIGIARDIFPNFDSFDDVRQEALINIIYNLGNRFRKFVNTIEYIRSGDWEKAAEEVLDSKWARIDVGKSRSKFISESFKHGDSLNS